MNLTYSQIENIQKKALRGKETSHSRLKRKISKVSLNAKMARNKVIKIYF